MGQDNLRWVCGEVQDLVGPLYSVAGPLHGLAVGKVRTHAAPHQCTGIEIQLRPQCNQDTWRNKIKADVRSDSRILPKPTIRHVYNSGMSFSTQSHGNHSVTISVSNNRVPCTFKTGGKKDLMQRRQLFGKKKDTKALWKKWEPKRYFELKWWGGKASSFFTKHLISQTIRKHRTFCLVAYSTWDEKVSCNYS